MIYLYRSTSQHIAFFVNYDDTLFSDQPLQVFLNHIPLPETIIDIIVILIEYIAADQIIQGYRFFKVLFYTFLCLCYLIQIG